jgi:hypothetical protein
MSSLEMMNAEPPMSEDEIRNANIRKRKVLRQLGLQGLDHIARKMSRTMEAGTVQKKGEHDND